MGFKYFSSGWILMVPKHSLLKYFTLTFTRHKSSKFEGSGPPLTTTTTLALNELATRSFGGIERFLTISGSLLHDRPTQSVMYVPLQVNRFHEIFTHRPVQIFKIMFRRFLFSRIWSSAQDHALLVLLLNLVGFSFQPDHASLVEMICTTVVPVSKEHLGGASP